MSPWRSPNARAGLTMRRSVSRVLLAATLVLSVGVLSVGVVPSPSGAAPSSELPPLPSGGVAAAGHETPEKCAGITRVMSGEICRLYQAFFQRDPDPAGLDHWRIQRARGVTLSAIADVFASSPEFQATYGSLSDEQAIDLIYQNVLGREPDAVGLAHWLARLRAGDTRGSVMAQFSNSHEFVVRTHTYPAYPTEYMQTLRLYWVFFARSPDSAGWAHWIAVRTVGFPLSFIADEFARSPEFVATYGELSNLAYVQLVYLNVLGRAGDLNGVAHWTAALDSGALTRGAVMASFSESLEYLLRSDTTP